MPCKNILDVMGKRGNRLPHDRKPFALHHGGVVERVFDREGGLMSDRSHQSQMLVVESFTIAGLNDGSWRGVSVDVKCTDDPVASLQRHAQRFSHSALHDRLSRIESRIVDRIAGSNAFFAFDHIVKDRAADRDATRSPTAARAVAG
jgi:hypothetical protein